MPTIGVWLTLIPDANAGLTQLIIGKKLMQDYFVLGILAAKPLSLIKFVVFVQLRWFLTYKQRLKYILKKKILTKTTFQSVLTNNTIVSQLFRGYSVAGNGKLFRWRCEYCFLSMWK